MGQDAAHISKVKKPGVRTQTEKELPGFIFSTTSRSKTADDLICFTELAVNSMAQRFRQTRCNEKM